MDTVLYPRHMDVSTVHVTATVAQSPTSHQDANASIPSCMHRSPTCLLQPWMWDEVGNVSALRAWTVSVSTELHQMLMVTVLANLMYVPFVACSIPFFVLVPTEEVRNSRVD
ncbi:hypothetical protein SARC_14898 [Sphaeroforma arctica JP610]|uniref:Uncharacterized protein n=1 Tax=Sphaeroforma arctica JP610 TaxID=667725 RepID=A0A0L0F736_9EUKA|nr:hypothetical protein SARC_14898 [Sphaeroforma arctica JP610]KNC72547.1 hypothetical protein SARC_14898 [Sphaeroforma arctica JP610]|eukprot:XP_014146449.1 hypothetical protein SARC_14898 [Sphaeroforma arctica JP610]